RWSSAGEPLSVPKSMAGLSKSSGQVGVKPPKYPGLSRCGSVELNSPIGRLQLVPLSRLPPSETIRGPLKLRSPLSSKITLRASTVLFVSVKKAKTEERPDVSLHVLAQDVTLTSVRTLPFRISMAPPSVLAEFALSVTLVSVARA